MTSTSTAFETARAEGRAALEAATVEASQLGVTLVVVNLTGAALDVASLTSPPPLELVDPDASADRDEVEQVLGITIDDQNAVLERAGRKLLARTRMECVLITRGSRGMAVFEPGKKTVHIPIFGSDSIADVTGAGDTVMATMTLALAAGASFEDAARLANYAGGI